MQVGHIDDVEIDGRKMFCSLVKKRPVKRIRVNIIAEEKGYNAYNKEYRTLLVDQPLFAEHSVPLIIKNILTPRPRTSPTNLKLIRHSQLTDHESCSKFLETISQQLIVKLERDVKQMQSNYMILSHYLTDAANKYKDLAELYLGRFESSIDSENLSSSEELRRSIRIAVENYIIYLMHGKLMASVLKLHVNEETILKKNYEIICSAKTSICDLGAQECFINFSVTSELISEIRKLPLLQSPIAIVNCLIRVIRIISHDLTSCVRFERLLSVCASDELVSICSDDLIASFALTLAQAKIDNLYSVAKYLEVFGWSSVDRDQAAYCVATFQIVVHYIVDYNKKAPDTIVISSSDQPEASGKISECLTNNFTEIITSDDVDIYSTETKKYDTSKDVDFHSKGVLRVDWER